MPKVNLAELELSKQRAFKMMDQGLSRLVISTRLGISETKVSLWSTQRKKQRMQSINKTN